MATSPRSPTDTSGLDQFEIGEGISPGGNPELLDALIDLGDESSPRGPGLAPPHTVTSDAMELSAPVLDHSRCDRRDRESGWSLGRA